MKVTLNIENDVELRAYIKDVIKGQVLSIVREEFLEIVKEEITKKIKGSHESQFQKLFESSFVKAIQNILYKEHKVSTWNHEFIKPYVEKNIDRSLKTKDWDKLVDDLVREKVRKLIS